MDQSSDRSRPAGSVGFYQEGPATSDRGEDEEEAESGAEGSHGDEDHTASGSEDDDDRADDDEDEEDGEEHRHGLLDIEASEESGSGDEEEEDDDVDDDKDDDNHRHLRSLVDLDASEPGDSDHGSDDSGIIYSFSSFMQLPAELRERVWEFFNPYLKNKGGRVLTCIMSDGWTPRIIETQVLSTITGLTNTMLAVHQETRALALKHFPHTLKSGTEFGLTRLNRDRDILFFSFTGDEPVPLNRFDVSSLFDEIGEFRNLAVEYQAVHPISEWLESPAVRQLTGRLDALYLNYETSEVMSKDLRWCFSLPTTTFCVDTEEEEPGLGEDSEYLYTWVDQNHPDFDHSAMMAECVDLYECFGLEELAGTALLPMAEFAFRGGTSRYDKLKARYLAGWKHGAEFSSDAEGSDLDDEPNEYESEGIDDDTIDSDSQDEEDDDLIVRDGDADDDSRPPTIRGSPDDPDDDMDDGGSDGEAMVARFSSIESDSPREGVSNASASVEDDDEGAPVQRTKRAKRPRVIDSDSEDDDADDGSSDAERRPRKLARRGPVVVLSDDSDEDEDGDDNDEKQDGESDGDKDDDEEEEEEDAMPSTRRKRRRVTRESSDDEDKDEDEDEDDQASSEEDASSDEDEKPRRPQTLAERLRLFRNDNPVPDTTTNSNNNSDSEGGGGRRRGEPRSRVYDDFNDDEDDDAYPGAYSDDEDDDEDGGVGIGGGESYEDDGGMMMMDTFDADSMPDEYGEDEEY